MIEILEDRRVLANWSGDIPDGTVWRSDEVQRIVGNVRVPSGATLTIEPGIVVKFNDFGDLSLVVEGTIIADGTASQPIVFTSFTDDTGLDGVLGTADDVDSNGNGPSNGVPSSWQRIEFLAASTGSVMDHVDIRFGGENVSSQVLVDGGLTMTNSSVRDSATGGVRIMSANPTIAGTTFRNNTDAALTMDLASVPVISGVTFSGNGVNGLNVEGGTLASDTTWDNPDIVYRLTGDVTVPLGRTLSIGAGQIMKSASFNEPGIIVDGTLIAAGTTNAHIVLTSDNDDSIGGDTLNNGPSIPSGGESGGLRFNPGSSGTLDLVEVRYAGDPFNSDNASSAIFINRADVTIRNGVVRDSGYYGVRIQNSDPTIADTSFENNIVGALSMDLGSDPSISRPTFTSNGINGLILDGGNLPADASWDDPDVVYHLPGNSRTNNLTGNVTVPQGTTLTIAPGQVIKAGSRTSTEIFVDGTLIAEGTRDAPIIFTSELDDSVGGDTTNNGASSGQFFDWQALRFRATSTGNLLDHVDVRFAGANVPAAVTVIGAPLTMTNSIVRGSASHAVAAQSAAAAVLRNNLLLDSEASGIQAESGATVTAFNNTIDGNFRGAVSDGSGTTLNLTDNLITFHTRSGVVASNGGTVNASFNDIFNPTATSGNYEGLADQTGLNANISVDPKYFNRTNSQYQLRAGSPAIDSGTSTGAPLTDIFGNPRFDDPNILNTGGGAVPFVDRGAIERQQISTSDVDLATIVVSGPTSGVQDEVVTVNWTVKNVGVGPAIGSWGDAVYLSVDPVWTPDDQLLGEKLHHGDLGPGLTYSESMNVTLPGALPGGYFFIVRSDSRNELFEAVAELNNALASADQITLDLPTLFFGTPLTGQLAATGLAKFYRIAAPAGADIAVNLTGSTGATNELYVKFGDIPSRQSFDDRGIRPNQPAQSISVSSTRAGSYFVMVFGADLPSPETFTLTTALQGFSISSVTPTRGSNTGQVTIQIGGAQFDTNSRPRLIDSAGNTLDPLAVFLTDSGLVSATFDLTGHPTGLADVQVVNSGGVTTTLPDGFNVIAGRPGRLVTNVSTSGRVRLGREFTVMVDYANEGDTDVPAPVMRLDGTGLSGLSLFPDGRGSANHLDLVGVNPTGPAGVLPPGAHGRITIYGRATSTGDESFQLFLGGYPNTPIDWVAIEPSIRPAGMTDAEWVPIFGAIQQQVGSTWRSYRRTIANAATLLPQSFGLNYSLNDVFRIVIEDAVASITNSVSGQLFLGDAGHPLGNVPISIFDSAQALAFSTYSRTDGSFVIPQVGISTYDLAVDGFILVSPPQVIVGAEGLTGVELLAQVGGAISGGVVLSAFGVPLTGVPVSAVLTDGTTFATTTDASGRYTLNGLPEGIYEVRAGGGQYTNSVIANVPLAEGAVNPHVNFQLDIAGMVRGRISGPTGPVGGASVTAVSENGGDISTTSDENGEYAITGLSAERYTVIASAPGLVPQQVRVNVPHGATVSDVDLSLAPAGSIEGSVTAVGSGSPIPFVFISVQTGQLEFSAQADAQGNFSVSELPSGEYTITVADVAFQTASVSTTVVAGSNVRVDLAVAPRGTVRGTVTRSGSGTPVVQVVVHASNATGLVASDVTDSSGMYELTGLDSGTYSVVVGDVASPGVADMQVAIASITPDVAVDFSIAVAGALSGTVRASDGVTPVVGARVALFVGEELVLSTISDANGRYSFIIVTEGEYHLEAFGSDLGFPPSGTITVTGGVTRADLDFTAGNAMLSGRVQSVPDGQPIAGATVEITRADAGSVVRRIGTLITDANGSFELSGVLPGSYRLLAQSEGRAFSTQTVLASSAPAPVTLALESESTVRGRLADGRSGVPLTGALVSLRPSTDLRLHFDTTTDSAGDYQIRGLAPGTYRLIAMALGHETAVVRSIALGREDRPTNITLDPESTRASGMVRSNSGPLPGVVVSAKDPDGIVVAQATSDAVGNYSVRSMPPGTYSLSTYVPGYRSPAPLNVTVVAGSPVAVPAVTLMAVAVSDPEKSTQGPGPAAAPVDWLNRFKNKAKNPAEIDRAANLPTFEALNAQFKNIKDDCKRDLAAAGLAIGKLYGTDGNGGLYKTWADSYLPLQRILNAVVGSQSRAGNASGGLGRHLNSLLRSDILEVLDQKLFTRFPGSEQPVQHQDIKFVLTLRAFNNSPVDSVLKVLTRIKGGGLTDSRGGSLVDATGNPVPDATGADLLGAVVAESQSLLDDLQLKINDINDQDRTSVTAAQKAIQNVNELKNAFQPVFTTWSNLIGHLTNRGRGEDESDKVGLDEKDAAETVNGASGGFDELASALLEGASLDQVLDLVKAYNDGNTAYLKAVAEARFKLVALEHCTGQKPGVIPNPKPAEPAHGSECSCPSCAEIFQQPDPETEPQSPDSAPSFLPRVELAGPAFGAESELQFDFSTALFAPVLPFAVCPEQRTDGPAIRTSFDPNDKHGPAGFGAAGYIQPGAMPYNIEFENDPNLGATIPAQEVFVTDTLDGDLDLTSVEFTSFGFNNRVYTVPPGLSNYEITIDLRPEGINLLVPVKLELNTETRKLKATFRSLDPLTGLLPDDVDAGFLPVNDKNLHNGEGFFTYIVRPYSGLATGTVIENQASIVFDVNAPILTPTARNTIDSGPPTSSVAALPGQSPSRFTVSWSGADDAGGSGIASYDIFVSQDDGPFSLAFAGTTETSHEFTGVSGSTYSFISVARDNVGHVETMPLVADTQTLVTLGAWVNPVDLYDVDGKGTVTTLDALLIINELGRHAVSDPITFVLTPIPPPGFAPPFYDVTEDGKITALDALRVINEIARRNQSTPISEAQQLGEAHHSIATLQPVAMWQPDAAPRSDARFSSNFNTEDVVQPVLSGKKLPASFDWHSTTTSEPNRALAMTSDSAFAADEAWALEATLSTFADDIARQWTMTR